MRFLGFLGIAIWFRMSNAMVYEVPPGLDQTTLMEASLEDVSFESADLEGRTITLVLHDTSVHLNLTRNPDVNNEIPVLLASEGQYFRWKGGPELVTYIDSESAASIIMQFNTSDSKPSRTYTGTFLSNTTEFFMEPMRAERRRRRKRQVEDVNSNYELYRRDERPLGSNAYNANGWPERDSSLPDNIRGQSFTLEVFIFLDYSIFQRWLDQSTASGFAAKEDDAISNIKFYFMHIMNGLDLRIKSIRDPDFSVSIKFVGMYIAKTSSDSGWTESVKEQDSTYTWIHADRALDSFKSWLNSTGDRFGSIDAAILLTEYELYRDRNTFDGSRRPLKGLTDMWGACSFYKVSVVKEAGLYATIQTIAHELGHSIGALHDTTGECPPGDNYIMSPTPRSLTPRTRMNPYRYSRCSVREIKSWLGRMNSHGWLCLYNQAPNFDPAALRDVRNRPAGQAYHPDLQCQAAFGPQSLYCAGDENDKKICQLMTCYHPERQRCEQYSDMRAYEGTSCDYCVWGDYKGRVDQKMSCDELGQNSPWLCYLQHYRDMCCAACEKIKTPQYPDCEYGDKYSWCSNTESRNCYEDYRQKGCCAMCRNFKTNNRECEYGDKYKFCQNIINRDCYYAEKDCCSTCTGRLAQSVVPNCKYGDQYSWCPNIKGYTCYSQSKACCETCERYKTNRPDCPFGDRRPFCSARDCDKPYNWNDCCQTCSSARGQYGIPQGCDDQTGYYCYDQPAGACYRDSHRRMCCASCTLRRKGPAGCEWGDQYNWCDDYVRRSPTTCSGNIQGTCCASCAKYN